MTSPKPRRNWFFTMLVPASVLFAVTAVAVAVVPAMEDRAAELGNPAPPSAFRTALREDGIWWLVAEVALVIVLSVAAMVFDDRGPLPQPSQGPQSG